MAGMLPPLPRCLTPPGTTSQRGPIQLDKHRIIGRRWKIVKKLGEGGCGSVYKVQDIWDPEKFAAMKAESNFVQGGSVLKLEAMVLKRLQGRPHVAQLLQAGKKSNFSYVVMTLLGDSLNSLVKKIGGQTTVSTQVRVGINVLYGIKQIHDIGFVHRDIKPANIAAGRKGKPESKFLHILDFGLSREYVMRENGQLAMRRPRQRALFRGTTRYCSICTHERMEQGRVDDLWSLLYMLAEMRGQLPWIQCRDKDEVAEIKKRTDVDVLLSNSPVELVYFVEHLNTLNYYTRPNYLLLYQLLMDVMKAGQFKFTDPYDWERNSASIVDELNSIDENNPFPVEAFACDPLGF